MLVEAFEQVFAMSKFPNIAVAQFRRSALHNAPARPRPPPRPRRRPLSTLRTRMSSLVAASVRLTLSGEVCSRPAVEPHIGAGAQQGHSTQGAKRENPALQCS